jgi:hypothetical protein
VLYDSGSGGLSCHRNTTSAEVAIRPYAANAGGDEMGGLLAMVGVLVLLAYVAGYLIGQRDGLSHAQTAAARLEYARERIRQAYIDTPGNPSLN